MFSNVANQTKSPFLLPQLPWPKDAFAKHLSVENFDYHYEKHHNAYVLNLNKLIISTPEFANKSLEELIIETHEKAAFQGIFNNAAQVWNHSFYWHSMSPASEDRNIDLKLIAKIEEDFGSLQKFNTEFEHHGISQFGSGWVWLVLDKSSNKLEIIKTSNAHSPICHNKKPLFTCDVWEHAYYIDYRNNRANYLKVFLENLVNWKFALENYLS